MSTGARTRKIISNKKDKAFTDSRVQMRIGRTEQKTKWIPIKGRNGTRLRPGFRKIL